MNKATRGRSVGKDGTGEGRGKEPAWYTTGLAERVDGWVASVGRGRSRLLFFLTLFFFVITASGKSKKKQEKRMWLVSEGCGGNRRQRGSKGTRTNRWSVAGGGGWVGATMERIHLR